jgi:hypothetical protein
MEIRSHLILLITVYFFFSFHVSGHFGVSFAPGTNNACAGITSAMQDVSKTIKDIRTTTDGVTRFFTAISRVISKVTSFTGWRVFALLFGVILISSVLTFIGIPRGGLSFIVSLAIADWIWVLWGKSITPDAPFNYAAVLKANAVLLLPFFAVLLLKKNLVPFGRKVGAGISTVVRIPFMKKKIVSKELLLQDIQKYHDASGVLQQRLLQDMAYSGDDSVVLSGKTVESIDEVTRILRELHRTVLTPDGGSSNKNGRKASE